MTVLANQTFELQLGNVVIEDRMWNTFGDDSDRIMAVKGFTVATNDLEVPDARIVV